MTLIPSEIEIEQQLTAAKTACSNTGRQLTALRQSVLEIILNARKPIGAYAVMAELEQKSDREHVAPPTVYRAIDFLLKAELVHRIHSLNAFVPKHLDRAGTMTALFICTNCGFTKETRSNTVQQNLNLVANELKFKIGQPSLEVLGLCCDCADQEAPHG